jgi:GTP cyclohydrolase I
MGNNDMPYEDDNFNTAVERYEQLEQYNEKSTNIVADHYQKIIEILEPEPKREGLLRTPQRIARAMQFLTHGYEINAASLLKSAMFQEDHKHMVVIKDIEIYSMCEHHMLPFFGKAHIAYIPNGWIVGLSKIPRVADAFARRLQVQERLTDQIKDCIQDTLNPLGVAVVIEAQHMCMQIRGVQKQNSVTTTSSFTGEFEKDSTRQEFFTLISSQLH